MDLNALSPIDHRRWQFARLASLGCFLVAGIMLTLSQFSPNFIEFGLVSPLLH
jgi:hypothetical protein